MPRLLMFLLLAVSLGCHSHASAQVATLFPVDEAAQQPDFFSFRARLLQAVEARDTAFLYSALAPNILNSFGGDGGVAEFREMWSPGDEGSRIWGVLTEILSLGGAFVEDSLFIAPYTSSSFPGEFDSFDHIAVIGSNVRVRARPDVRSRVLTTLSFDIVEMFHGDAGLPARGWVRVQLADGRRGYVAADYTRSPVARRAGFVRRDGRWLLRFLVAGD